MRSSNPSARDALEIATRGGADVLGRPDCGRLVPGKRADIAVWDIGGLDSAGSWDPAALLLAGPTQVRDLIVNGRAIISDRQLRTQSIEGLMRAQTKSVSRLRNQIL